MENLYKNPTIIIDKNPTPSKPQPIVYQALDEA